MKLLLTMNLVVFLLSTQVYSQNEKVTYSTFLKSYTSSLKTYSINVSRVKLEIYLVSRKMDRINAEIDSKVRGSVDLFLIENKTRMC